MIRCPVCTEAAAFAFLTRHAVPVHQNMIMPSATAARQIRRGTLEMACCERCGFAFNRAFDPALLDYGRDYDNTQTHSPAFKAYTDDLVARVRAASPANARVVEVGCGKGQFLRTLIESAPEMTGWGFDPSYVGPERVLDGRLEYRREFYGPGCEALKADVVICRHVIEHVADPVALLDTVRAALALSPDARMFFETPALEWILEHVVVWDLFYEHCSLFTPASITTAFERAGFEVTAVEHIFEGQYLWTEARLGAARHAPEAGDTPELARRFAREEQRWLAQWRSMLASPDPSAGGPARGSGGGDAKPTKIAVWGAGAKGATFANLTDPDGTRIDCIVDLNPNKQGRFLPGTGHPIVAPAALAERGVGRALLMNPNYRPEISQLLRDLRLEVALEDPFS